MKISLRVYSIIINLYNANILLARGDEISVRRLTEMMAQQLKNDLGPAWGYKRSSITYMDEEGIIWEYSWQDKNTKHPYSPPGDMMISSTQVFTPVIAVDHLGTAKLENKEPSKELKVAGE